MTPDRGGMQWSGVKTALGVDVWRMQRDEILHETTETAQ
jgi:hypothetical protein